MLDPLLLMIISIGFGLMFLLAALHKLTALQRFRAVLDEYRVLPAALLPAASIALPIVEIGLGLGWLFFAEIRLLAMTTAGVIALYTLAIGINLLRGRVHISCGCGFGKSAEDDDALSWGLVVRNAFLIGVALASALPASDRTFGIYDYLALVAALIVVVLLFIAGNQLIRNSAAINSWRRPVERND